MILFDKVVKKCSPNLLRQQELNIQQHETITELEDFAENAHSSILYILLNVFGATDEEMSYAASHVGVCSGIVTQLRGMAQLASQVHFSEKMYIIYVSYFLPPHINLFNNLFPG